MKTTVGAVIEEPGSTIRNKTGGWRTLRPDINKGKCIKCGNCWLYCPDACYTITPEGAVVDLDFCKGCGICAKVCPVRCITMVKEEK